jgi:hypothetical protein
MANQDVSRGDQNLIERFINYSGSRVAKLRAVILYNSSEAELFTSSAPGTVAIGRDVDSATLTIAESAALSDALDFRAMAGAMLTMPAAWTAASIGFKVCATSGGTYLPLYDEDGTLVQISSPAVDKAYSFPAEVYAASYVKLWSQDGSGNNTTQDAARSIGVMAKG